MKIDWKNISIGELAAIVSEKLLEKDIYSLVVGGAWEGDRFAAGVAEATV